MAPQSTHVIRPNTPTMLSLASSTAVASALESPDHIPRPRNAFIIFRADRSKKYQGRTAGDISQLVAAEWKSLATDVKARYERQADEEKQRHKVLYPHYRFQPKQKPKVKDKEERKKMETKVAEKLEARRAQKRAARARAKKRQQMETVMQQMSLMPLPVPPLGYPPQLDPTSHLPFIPVFIPNPAYLAQAPTSTISTHLHVDSAVPPLAPLSPPSPAAPGLDSGPVTPVVAGSPVRAPIEVGTTPKKEDRAAKAPSPIIASASPIQQGATVSPWPPAFDPAPVCGFDPFAHEAAYSWFDYSIPPLSSPDFCGSLYSNSYGSTSSLQLSEASTDAGDWSAFMDGMLGSTRADDPFGAWDAGPFGPSVASTAATSSDHLILAHFSSPSLPTSATAGRTRRSPSRQLSLAPDGVISYDAPFNAGLHVLPEWGNCLGLENSDGQDLKF